MFISLNVIVLPNKNIANKIIFIPHFYFLCYNNYTSFLKEKRKKLREEINVNGVIDEMPQGEYSILRESPYVKTYNTMIQRYTTVNDKLISLLPKDVVKEVDDGFDSFVMDR